MSLYNGSRTAGWSKVGPGRITKPFHANHDRSVGAGTFTRPLTEFPVAGVLASEGVTRPATAGAAAIVCR